MSNYGFVRVATASPQQHLADPAANAAEIIGCMNRANQEGASVLVLPELALTGCTCGDLLLQTALQQAAADALQQIIKASAGLELLCFVGLPACVGNKLYNCTAAVCNGALLALIPKTHLNPGGDFMEQRWFAPAPKTPRQIQFAGARCWFGTTILLECSAQPGLTIAAEVGEDLWVPEAPSARHALAGALLIANPAAGSDAVGKAAARVTRAAQQAARYHCAYLYAGGAQGESTTDLVFSGHDFICEDGAVLTESKPFNSGFAITEIDLQALCAVRQRDPHFTSFHEEYIRIELPFLPPAIPALLRPVAANPFLSPFAAEQETECETILRLQAHALAQRLQRAQAKTAVIGISGGLDSCLALLVAVRAYALLERPTEDILAVTMPCFGTSRRTRDNAETLCRELGVGLREIPIERTVTAHFADIAQNPALQDVTYENAQARVRTLELMDLANQHNGLVVGTGDLSELALGWATYNGDHMSMYGVNAGVPKTVVRRLVRYEADHSAQAALAAVLRDILNTPVSPELLPTDDAGRISQQTEALIGPYELHDFYIYYALVWGFSPAKLLFLAENAFGSRYERKVLLHWLKNFYRRFVTQQFKRSCMPDGPKVGPLSLSPRGGFIMPSDASASLWIKEAEALE